MLVIGAISNTFAQKTSGSDVSINKEPILDLGRELKRKIDSKELDLNSTFAVEMSGVVDRNGKLEKVKVIRKEGDQKVVDAVKDVIVAIGDSGYLQYLQSLGASEINFTAKQDDVNFSAVVSSSLKTGDRANSTASVLSLLLAMARSANQEKQRPVDFFLVNSTKARADKDKVFIDFAASKEKLHQIISDELEKIKP